MKRDTSEVIASCPFCSDALEVAGAGYMHPLNNGTRPFCLLSGMTVLPDHIEFWNRRPDAFHEAPAECDACGGLVACPRCDAEPADAGRAVPYGWLEPETGNFVDHATKLEMPADAATFTLAVYTRPPSEAAAVDDAMVDAFSVAEQRVYNEIHDMATPDLYRLAVRKGIEAALASQQAVKP